MPFRVVKLFSLLLLAFFGAAMLCSPLLLAFFGVVMLYSSLLLAFFGVVMLYSPRFFVSVFPLCGFCGNKAVKAFYRGGNFFCGAFRLVIFYLKAKFQKNRRTFFDRTAIHSDIF